MKYLDAIILFLLITEKSGKMLILPEEVTTPTSECIVHILNKYFINSKKILIKYSNPESMIVSEVLRKTDIPFLINADDRTNIDGIDKRIPNDLIMILDEPIDSLKVSNEIKWTAKTQFLVVINKAHELEGNMIDLFREFWVNNIVKVLALVLDNDDVQIYTFIPFNSHDCAVHKPVRLASFTSGQITTQKELVSKERVTNLNGCTLKAIAIHFPPGVFVPPQKSKNGTSIPYGTDVSLLLEISNQLKFKLNFTGPEDGKAWGRMEPSPFGAVGDIFFKKVHFACGTFAYTLPRYKKLDLSVPIGCESECVSWAVPIGAKKAKPAWIGLLTDGFSNNVWYFIICTFGFTTAAFRILSKASLIDSRLFNENVNTIFYTFRSSIGSSPRVPKRLFLRILLLSWLWYSFVLSTSYQALMGSKLTVPFRLSNIDTFKDLLESDLHIMGLFSTFQLVIDGQDETEIKAIQKRFVKTDISVKEVMKKITSERNLAYIWTSTKFMYDVKQHAEAKGLVHFMKKCAANYHPTLVLQKNCPFTERVNRIITALFESGIIRKWKKQYLDDTPEAEPTVKKLSLYPMMGSFVIFGVGLGVALITFAAENLYFWVLSRKNIRIEQFS